MMKRRIIILFALITCFQYSCDMINLDGISTPGTALSAEQVAEGLKQALEKGSTNGAKELSAKDGFFKSAYKILLPKEAEQVASKLRNVPGFSDFEDKMVLKLNRAAEDAAKSAVPIFVSAIKQMTIKDAWNILRGQKDAATQYLIRATSSKLYDNFRPKIKQSLNKFGAVDYYADAINAYNKLPFVDDLNPDIDDYVTNKALDGLYSEIAKIEKDIRENPVARTTELLRKVFAQQD